MSISSSCSLSSGRPQVRRRFQAFHARPPLHEFHTMPCLNSKQLPPFSAKYLMNCKNGAVAGFSSIPSTCGTVRDAMVASWFLSSLRSVVVGGNSTRKSPWKPRDAPSACPMMTFDVRGSNQHDVLPCRGTHRVSRRRPTVRSRVSFVMVPPEDSFIQGEELVRMRYTPRNYLSWDYDLTSSGRESKNCG
jgi:hypothetical protein